MAIIAATLTNLVGPAIQLGTYIVAPIKRQFSYLCCFGSNIQNLRNEDKKLDDARAGLQMQVDAAERNAEVIFPEVETWLTEANEHKINTLGIENEVPKVQHGPLNMKSRFSLSMKARKATEAMKALQNRCTFNYISQPAPPTAIVSIPSGQTYEFESRKKIEEDIVAALKDKNVNLIGLCGMGGIGKTTMVKRITNKVREEHLFDEIVMVVVGQQVEMLKIQHELAESLGLNLVEETLSARANKLYTRLTSTKRILVILDDVWEMLKLEDLGISLESSFNRCTILLTSRDRNVLEAMEAQMIREMQILVEKEAWFLFREKAGTCVDNLNLHSIARKVMKECKGLPIALITVGRALRNKESKALWKDALHQLKYCNPIDMPRVLVEVYNPLKLSYDFLDNQHARSLFLLCSLFPEDLNISLEYLTWNVIGLRMFKGIRNLAQTRNRVCTIAEMLKSCFLLLEGCDEQHVKMHDIVRDVAIFIASKEGRVNRNFSSMDGSVEHSYSDYNWISMTPKERIELCTDLNFPKHSLLWVESSEEIDFPMKEIFFEGMRDLNVLSLTSIWFSSLPRTIQLLKNLRTLCLDSCTLRSISIIGDLSSLEILCFRFCHNVVEMPVEIRKLHHLRLLEFSYCTSLKTIAPGIISNLFQLEELKMIGSFRGWEAGKATTNVSLHELESLFNLTCLEIEISNCALAMEEIRLSPKIAKFDIRIYGKWPSNISFHEKKMFLNLWRETDLGTWIRKFLRNTEFLDLTGDGSDCLDLVEVQNVKSFGLNDCSTVKRLVTTTSIGNRTRFLVFPVLESLWLCRLEKLKRIFKGSIPDGSNSFRNLKELTLDHLPSMKYLWKSPDQNVSLSSLRFIHIWYCDKLQSLLWLTMARGLSELEMLEIKNCENMEEVFSKNNGDQSHLTLPKLKRMSLGHLPSLTSFCKGIGSIEFPGLVYMDIENCPKLSSLASIESDDLNRAGHDDDSFHLFCDHKVAFGSLKELNIRGYKNIRNTWCRQIPLCFFNKLEMLEVESFGNIKSLFSSSIAENLVNLKELEIKSCKEMVYVIEDEEEYLLGESVLFPSLLLLDLLNLPKLESFCKSRCDFVLPSLKNVLISECPLMGSVTLGSVSEN